MRAFLVGLVSLILSSSALGQATGFVESIGIDNRFRPDGWTSMVINLTSQISTPATYQIQIIQEDLDKDSVIFTRDITLSPNAQEKYWAFFLPQPTGRGLPTQSMAELERSLHVYLCAAPSSPDQPGKQLMKLPIKLALLSLDPIRDFGDHSRGRKLILCVTDGSSKPAWVSYQTADGLMEDVEAVGLHPGDLPENVLAYAAVDGIVWLSGSADQLEEAGARRLPALKQYVREGGQLVVCQPAERSDVAKLADLLPVELKDKDSQWLVDIEDKKDLRPLSNLARRSDSDSPGRWSEMESKGPFKMARARQLKSHAIVDTGIDWKADGHDFPPSPYIAKWGYGLGSVTWVAQDLGNPNLTGPLSGGWPYVWDHIFGWHNDTYEFTEPSLSERIKKSYETTEGTVDLGASLLKGMEFERKVAYYIFVAMAFFVIYWFVAGPGSFLFLSTRRRKELSWFIFGAAAVVAALLTVLVVRVVLRGSPEIRHLSVVRSAPGQPTYVHSRVGLYIPRDGRQTVELKDNSAEAVSTLTPLEIHPQYVNDNNDFPSAQEYVVPVPDTADQPVRIQVPFRSTLKKIEARWVGDTPGAITGSAQLVEKGFLSGKLTNSTGVGLRAVYLAFHYPPSGQDEVLFLPSWNDRETIDLGARFSKAVRLKFSGEADGATPLDQHPKDIQATIRNIWESYWLTPLNASILSTDKAFDDSADGFNRSFVLMSFFDRVRPERTEGDFHRVELLRRGGRDMNMSPAIDAGELVVLGEASGQPLPFPLLVNGDAVRGEGTCLYQFALPLDRSALKE